VAGSGPADTGYPPVILLVNARPGRGLVGQQVEPLTRELARAGRGCALVDTDADPVARCRALLAAGPAAAVVAVGGDGTVHLALQTVAGTGVPFGIVPAGTGNDIATELGFPDAERAVERICAALNQGRTRPVDLGRVRLPDGQVRWFGGVFGAGFDAIVNERANGMRFPRGRRRYDVAILAELARLRPRRYKLELDGVVIERDAVLVAVGNTASYGGGFRICPGANPADGLLDVLVGGRFNRLGLVRVLPRVRRGGHLDHPLVESFRAGTITIGATDITGYADGERIAALPLTITCVPGALTLLS
jgi:diacylglycerol kinase (ATP)